MALCRIRSAEQLRYEAPGELGKVMGLDRIPEVRTLRSKMEILCSQAGLVENWSAQLAKHWMEGDEELAGVLCVDGHVRVYHGDKAVLPRRYVSRQRLCLRGTTDYWVNDLIGQPYFVVSREWNDGLLAALREQIVPQLLRDVPEQPSEVDLAADPWRHRFILVFDREGSSPAFFKEMWENHRIACLSYRKQVEDDWPVDEFQKVPVPMPGGNQENMWLAERGAYWGKQDGLWVREVRKRSDSGHQISIITTGYELKTEQTSAYMFSRWSQENYFRYMMADYNIDALCEYGVEAVDETKKVVNPEWRRKDGEVKSLKAKLNRRRVEYSALELDADVGTDKLDAYQRRKAQLKESVDELLGQVNKAKEERQALTQKVMVRDLPPNEKIKRLLPSRKQFMDTVKMIAYRAETALCGILKNGLGRNADARPLAKDIFRMEANLRPAPDRGRLFVELHRMSNPQADRAVAQLLEQLNQEECVYPGTNLILEYKQVSTQNP